MKSFVVIFWALLSVAPTFAEEIKIYNWDAFLSEKVITEFTKRTGHTVTQYYFDSEIERNAMIMNGQGDKFDLIIVDAMRTLEFGGLHKLKALSGLNIGNQQYNSLQSRNSCGDYGIPYSKGTMGIIHRTSISVNKIDSWNHLLTPPKEHLGSTLMLKDDIDTTAIALLALGLDPFTEDKAALKQAYGLLVQQSKMLLTYAYPISYLMTDSPSPKLSLSVAYSGDLFNIRELSGHEDWEFVIPKEGTLLFVDCFTLPERMPVKKATTAFLAFINEPVIAAQNAQEAWFSTTNEAALLLTSDEFKNDRELSPNSKALEKSHNYRAISNQGVILRNRMTSMLQIQK